MNHVIALTIAKACVEKFKHLSKRGKPSNNQWTVLSAIVLVRTVDGSHDVRIISLASGTKCLDGVTRHNALPGTLIHDSHAEVLARRGFKLWLIEEILVAKQKLSEFIALVSEDKYDLIPDWKIFLFSTHPPCGDATIFEKNNLKDFNYEPASKKLKVDLNRTGAKSVNGSDPLLPGLGYHTVGLIRTKPGRGVKTLSLSCSDKILKWNTVGLQGAIASHFLTRSLFLTGVIISSELFDQKALERALFKRSEDVNCRPVIVHTNLDFEFSKSDLLCTPCPDSVVWIDISGGVHEALTEGHKQGWAVKKLSNAKSWSVLCQRNIAQRFLDCNIANCRDFLTYADIKLKSPNYYKRRVEGSFLSRWPPKQISEFPLITR